MCPHLSLIKCVEISVVGDNLVSHEEFIFDDDMPELLTPEHDTWWQHDTWWHSEEYENMPELESDDNNDEDDEDDCLCEINLEDILNQPIDVESLTFGNPDYVWNNVMTYSDSE